MAKKKTRFNATDNQHGADTQKVNADNLQYLMGELAHAAKDAGVELGAFIRASLSDEELAIAEGNGQFIKTYQYDDETFVAAFVEVAACEVDALTEVHPLNPRSQRELSIDAVDDILPSIRENGVDTPGVAIRCADTGKLLIVDASRRRFCAIEAGVPLPLYELSSDVPVGLVMRLIDDSFATKQLSNRERGIPFLKFMEDKGIGTVKELATHFDNIGATRLGIFINAARIPNVLVDLFVDPNGMTSSQYKKLHKIYKAIDAHPELSIDDATELSEGYIGTDKEEQREYIFAELQGLIDRPSESVTWTSMIDFDDPTRTANVKYNAKTKAFDLKLKRVPKEVCDEIEELVKQRLAILNDS